MFFKCIWRQRHFSENVVKKCLVISNKMCNQLLQVESVNIDAHGVFKYILIQVSDKKAPNSMKNIVRGFQHCAYHGKCLF